MKYSSIKNMKNKSKVIVFGIVIFTFIISVFLLTKQIFKDDTDDMMINISYLSDEFIEEYFEEISEADSDEEKENMLIVISDSKIEDSYGAINIIEAPNNQYILQYDSEEEKNKALEKLESDKSIASIEKNEVYQIEDVTYNSWGINKMSLDYAIDNSNIDNLEEVTVAIIDTGCDISLFNKYYGGRIAGYYNILEKTNTIMNDTNGHGTHIAGTIAEGTPSNVKIFPIKVSTDGSMYITDIIAAITYVTADKKADVINMSFGGYGKSEALEQAIEAAKKKNIISVAASGNNNTSREHYPSSFDNTIAISSVDSELKKSSFSNYGSKVTFAAPGTNIKSIMGNDTSISKRNGNSDGDNDHETISGTSMATPHAVAAVAILKGYNKNLTFENVIDILKDNAQDLGEEGWDEYYGYGLISFKDVEFCDGTYCDEFGIYKDLTKKITKIEFVDFKFTDYNYYSVTNIMGSKVKVYYSDETTEESLLSDLPSLQVLNYLPESTECQTITIKVGDFSTNVEITNPSNYSSAWEYEMLSNGNIKITGYRNNGLTLNRLYVPEAIDSKKVESFADDIKFSEFTDFEYYEYLYLPSNFKRIGNYSLSNTNIKYVYGDSSGIEIGAHGFESSKIETIDIVITKVESYGFKDCFKLKSVDVSGVFDYISVGNLEVGEAFIEEYAFYNCKELTIVKHSKYDIVHIYTLGSHAFYNCISLSNFELEVNGNIEEYAFYNTFVLTDINLYQSDSIGQYAFYGSGITEADLGLIDIVQPSSFENCKNLKAVEITSGRIESRAFWNSGLENIFIGHMVTYISDDAFAYSPLKSNNGSQNDATAPYRVIHDLGIIDNSNNKLIVGFTDAIGASNTNITEDITEIGEYAFTGNTNLKKIIIPETIKKIGQYAFKDCYELENVYMLGNSISFYDDTFKRTYEGDVKNADLFIYVHKNADLKQSIIDKKLNYRHIEPDEIIVSNAKTNYVAFESVTIDDMKDMSVKLVYHEKEEREEELSLISYGNRDGIFSSNIGFNISYANENYYKFYYGDTYYVLNAYNSVGYLSTKNIEVTIDKAMPTYTVPTDLTAYVGQKLSEITLPNGFTWMDPDEIIEEAGNVTFKAKFTPEDIENYKIIENIEITINANQKIYVLTFDANGGTGTMSDQEFVYGTLQKITKNTYTKEGYTFTEWNTKADGTGTTYTDEQEISITEKLVLYAQWQESYSYIINEYSVDETTKIIKDIPINTSEEQFRNNIELNMGYALEIIKQKDKINIGTNTLIKIYKNEQLYKEFTAVVKGDITGDGLISLADMSKFYNYYQGNITVNRYFELSADVSGDGKFSLADLSKFYNYYQGKINKL